MSRLVAVARGGAAFAVLTLWPQVTRQASAGTRVL